MKLGSDRRSAVAWAAFGAVVLVASWRLDRLENLHINPWSAPGLTPGVVGLLMIVLAAVLAIQSGRSPPDSDAAPGAGGGDLPVPPTDAVEPTDEGNVSRTLLASLLCVLFAGVSLGHGLPFMVEGAAFILVFAAAFSWSQWRAEGRIGRGLLTTFVVALASSATISWLFESVFLVRLP